MNLHNVQERLARVGIDSNSSKTSSCFSESDDSELEEPGEAVNFVERIDAFEEQQFQLHMRMKRQTVEYIISRYSDYVTAIANAEAQQIDAKKSVYMYVWYMCNIASFKQLGKLFRISTTAAWLAVRWVTACISKLRQEFLKWPQGEDVKESQKKFEQTMGVPDAIGAIACTHIEIKAPKFVRQFYFTKKQPYTISLQVVVDSEKRFIDVACGEPGSLQDTEVLQRSDMYKKARANEAEMFPHESFILGGPSYPSTNWLVTPFMRCDVRTEAHQKFNEVHSAGRRVVDDTLDLVKRRFPRVMKFNEDISLCATISLIVSACVLHNLCLARNDLYEDLYSYGINTTAPEANSETLPVAGAGSNRREEVLDSLQEQKLN